MQMGQIFQLCMQTCDYMQIMFSIYAAYMQYACTFCKGSSSDGGSTVEENDDECSYKEKGHDVDSIVLTVRTTELYIFQR